MKNSTKSHGRSWRLLSVVSMVTLLLLTTLWGMAAIAYADGPLSDAGYKDFSYGGTVKDDPTAQKPESKLWWNDGFWWGSLWSPAGNAYHIYRLNWGTQIWEDTGVAIDDRWDSRADTLWDEANNKLYVVSHIAKENSSQVNGLANWGRLYRYSYDEASQSYSLDSDFSTPPTVNEDRTEALVLEKDSHSTPRLWVTYVSRPQGTSDYQVYANVSVDDGLNWGTPFTLTLNITPTAVHVAQDDLSSVVSFKDDLGDDKIGIMWSNQLSGTLHFAYRDDGDALNAAWTHQAVPVPGGSDDHISIKSLQATSSGVFAAVKTSAANPTDPLIGLVTRDPDGTLAFHTYSTEADNDTRPILLIDEGNESVPGDEKAHIFVVGKPAGSHICYKSLPITSPPSGMGNFPTGNCGTEFIKDATLDKISNPTSTKNNVHNGTGLVVLAADNDNGRFYVHNVLGEPPPVVTNRSPERNATDVPVGTVITATFSKEMNASTLNSSSFKVEDSSGQIAGNISYDNDTRTVTFTPSSPLTPSTGYTVTLTGAVQDASVSNNPLYGAPEVWTLTTVPPMVLRFGNENYSIGEDLGPATITVTLSTPSGQPVSVDYAASDGTATAGDYTATSGTLTFAPSETSKTFTVPIIDDALDEPDETVSLTLSNPSINATLGSPANATLTILDNDLPPAVQFSSSAYSVAEDAGPATITVNLSTPSGKSVSVGYSTSDGTATAGSDYTATSGTLTFDPNETSKTFTVPIIDDAENDPDETVSLTLNNPSNATLGTPASATLTILESGANVYLPAILRN